MHSIANSEGKVLPKEVLTTPALDSMTRDRLQSIFTDMSIPSQSGSDVTFDQIIEFIEEVKPVSLNLWGVFLSDQQMHIILLLCKCVKRLSIDFSFNKDPRLSAELGFLTHLNELRLNRFCSHLSFDLRKLNDLEAFSTTGCIVKDVPFFMPASPNLKTFHYTGNNDNLDLSKYPHLEEIALSSANVEFPVSMPQLKKVVMVTKQLDIFLPREAPLLEHVEIYEDIEESRTIHWPEHTPNLRVKRIDEHSKQV